MVLKQIEGFISKFQNGQYARIKQNSGSSNICRKSNETDGLIDFRMSSRTIYNLTRAFTKSIYWSHISYNEKNFPDVFVDIDKYIDKKIEIMNVYKGEISVHPFPRSESNIKALETYRGATSGCHYAESFILLKEIRD